MLGAPANLGDADEILLGEDGVVEGKQCGSLPLREGVGEQGAGRVGAAVEAERDGGGAGVVGVLYELLQDGGSLRVVEQNLADAARQINRLAEVFQKDGFRRRRHCYRRVLILIQTQEFCGCFLVVGLSLSSDFTSLLH